MRLFIPHIIAYVLRLKASRYIQNIQYADPKMACLIKEGPAIFGSAYCNSIMIEFWIQNWIICMYVLNFLDLPKKFLWSDKPTCRRVNLYTIISNLYILQSLDIIVYPVYISLHKLLKFEPDGEKIEGRKSIFDRF